MFIPTPKTTTMANSATLASVPPIPLDRPDVKKIPKTSYVTFKLRTNPTDNDSPEYDFSMAYFRSGTAEDLLIWLKNLNKVFVGMNVTNGPGQYAMARRVLQGDALSAFERAVAANGNETVEHLKKCLTALKKHVFPLNSYQRQRHYLNRGVRKPKDWTVREFMTRLSELNDYLGDFPDPNDKVKAKKFEDHEIADIASNAIPNSWRKAMAMHNFDPLIHTATEFTQFCERIQFAEGISPHKETSSHTESSTGKSGGKVRAAKAPNKKKRTATNASKWCELHHTDTHDTGECKVLLAQAKKMRGTWEAGGVAKGNPNTKPAATSNSNHGGKSVHWKGNQKDNYAFELGTLIGKMINSATKTNDNAGSEAEPTAMEVDEHDPNNESEEEEGEVEVIEQYQLDAIDEFVREEVANEEKKPSLNTETKKNSGNGSD